MVCVHKLAGLRLDSSPAGLPEQAEANEAENFTPAAPEKQRPTIEVEITRTYNEWATAFYDALCDFAFDEQFPEDEEGVYAQIVDMYTLYQQEIEDVITRISEEISEIGADPQLGQWSQQQIAAILNALQRAQQIVILPGNSQDPSKTSTYRGFPALAGGLSMGGKDSSTQE